MCILLGNYCVFLLALHFHCRIYVFFLRIDAQRAKYGPVPDPWEATGGGRGRVNPPPLTRISEILERRRNTKAEYEVGAQLTLNHLTP